MSRASRLAAFNGHRTAWSTRWALTAWHLGYRAPLRRFGLTNPNQAERVIACGGGCARCGA